MIYFLDTNIIVIYLRNGKVKEFIEKKYSALEKRYSPSLSVVTLGEIRSLAIKNSWGNKRIEKLEELLKEILVIDIDSVDIINRYAEIDAFSQGRLNGRVSKFSARNMGKNDIWIAATASVLDATLLTTDSDFDHLDKEFLKIAKVELNF